MSSILIINLNDSSHENEIPSTYDFSKVIFTNKLSQAEEYIDVEMFDIISIQTSIINEEILSFSRKISKETSSGLLFFINTIKSEDKIYLEKHGIYVLQNTTSNESITSLIRIILSNKNRFLKIENKFLNLQTSIEEEKLINRAKCILIQYLNMTETQAHKYIEKQSMNLRQSKTQTAESILKTYES